MSTLMSLFLTLVMVFGIGTPRESALSQQYQAGNWDGHRIGIFHPAEVRDGILFIGNTPSSYPADSSKDYYMPSVYSFEKGTWFADSYSDYNFGLVMRFDKRGKNIKTIDFSSEISKVPGRKNVEATVSDDHTKILVIVYCKDGTKITYSFPVDPDEIGKSLSVVAASETSMCELSVSS